MMPASAPPPDNEQQNIIDKLAQFVARNGLEFEAMTKDKQQDNPKFAFLYGGEYYDYYRQKVEEEKSVLQKQHGGNIYMPQWGRNRMERCHGAGRWDERSSSSSWQAYGAPPNWQTGPWSHCGAPRRWGPGSRPGNAERFPGMPYHHHHHQQQPSAAVTAFPPICGYPLPRAFPAPRGFPCQPAAPPEASFREEDILKSEENLKAQFEVIMWQKEADIKSCRETFRIEAVKNRCFHMNVSFEDMNSVIQPLVESCTKENIAKGKNWVVDQMAKTEELTQLMADYLLARVVSPDSGFDLRLHVVYLLNDLLHHLKRRNITPHLQTTLQKIVIPVYCLAMEVVDEAKRNKLSRVLDLWESNGYLPPDVLKNMRPPESESFMESWREEEAKMCESKILEIVKMHTDKYKALERQHEEFANHVRACIAERLKVEAALEAEQLARDSVEANLEDEEQQLVATELPPHMDSDHSMQMPQQEPPYWRQPANPYGAPCMRQESDYYPHNPGPYSQNSAYMPPPGQMVHGCEPQGWRGPISNYPPHLGNAYMSGNGEDYIQDSDYAPYPSYMPGGMHPRDSLRDDISNLYEGGDYDDYYPAGLPRFPETGGASDFRDWASRGPPCMLPPSGAKRFTESAFPPPPASLAELPADLKPTCPVWQLPAGLMHSLIGLKDFDFTALDTDKMRLLAPEPASEQLLAAIDVYYTQPTHDRPRDPEGWERLGLLDFYRAKEEARDRALEKTAQKAGATSERVKRSLSQGSAADSPLFDSDAEQCKEKEDDGDVEADEDPDSQPFRRHTAGDDNCLPHLAYLTAYPSAAIGQPLRTGKAAIVSAPPPILPIQSQLSQAFNLTKPPGLELGDFSTACPTGPVPMPPGAFLPPGQSQSAVIPPMGFMNFPPPPVNQPPPSAQVPLPAPPHMMSRDTTNAYRRYENRALSVSPLRSRSYSRSRSHSSRSISRESRSRSRSRSRSGSRSGDWYSETASNGSRSRSRSRSPVEIRDSNRSRSSRPGGNNGAVTTAGYLRRGQRSPNRHNKQPWPAYEPGRPKQLAHYEGGNSAPCMMPSYPVYRGVYQRFRQAPYPGGYGGNGFGGGPAPPMGYHGGGMSNPMMPQRYAYQGGGGRKPGAGYQGR